MVSTYRFSYPCTLPNKSTIRFILVSFNDGKKIINGKEVRIWKEAVVAYFIVLTRHSIGEKDKSTRKLNQDNR